MNPKISVLIPMYNRKHYIAQCLDSALNQTFKEEYEIIVRDDASTDGGYEFVQEKYSQQISEGKIKLRLNIKNLDEFPTENILIREAAGKYITFLHSDDMYLPNALQHLYEVAEETNADVVHSSFLLRSSKTGIIQNLEDLKVVCGEKNFFDKITIMPNNSLDRFNEWLNTGTFIDVQYNIFRRAFIVENEIFFDSPDNRYFSLWWIMLAKVFVKTPTVFYVYRDSPVSQTNKDFTPEKLEKFIATQIEMVRNMDKRFAKIDFFKNNEYFQYIAKAHLIYSLDIWEFIRRKIYSNGITPELYQAAVNAFKKIFGEDYFYPMFLFNYAHVTPYNKRVDTINFNDNTPQIWSR